jgi:hypothetical protein
MIHASTVGVSESLTGSRWHKETSRYKIVDTTETVKGMDGMDKYVFVVRIRVGE